MSLIAIFLLIISNYCYAFEFGKISYWNIEDLQRTPNNGITYKVALKDFLIGNPAVVFNGYAFFRYNDSRDVVASTTKMIGTVNGLDFYTPEALKLLYAALKSATPSQVADMQVANILIKKHLNTYYEPNIFNGNYLVNGKPVSIDIYSEETRYTEIYLDPIRSVLDRCICLKKTSIDSASEKKNLSNTPSYNRYFKNKKTGQWEGYSYANSNYTSGNKYNPIPGFNFIPSEEEVALCELLSKQLGI